MKQAIFIAQEKNLNRFSDVFEGENIFVTPFKAAEIPSLTAFISRERTVVQQDFIIIDVGSVSMWSISHILSAVQHLHRFSNATVIFIGEPSEELTELYGTLASVQRISQLITDKDGVDVPAELRRCLTPENSSSLGDKTQFISNMLVQQTMQIAKPLNISPDLVLQIALAGAMPRCGVTTQTFALCHYLKSLGFRPAILDEHGKLISLMKQYESCDFKSDDVICVKGVDICTELKLPQYNAYLMDFGELSPHNVQRFCEADVSILVCCTKPWEIRFLAKAIQTLMGRPHNKSVTLASFSNKEELDKLGANLGEYYGLAPYVESIWRSPEDVSAYEATILRALKEICAERHRNSPDLEVS